MLDRGFLNIPRIPELRKKLLITLGLLAVYRIGIFVPTPGVDVEVIKQFFQGTEGTLFGLINLFSGGALGQLSIFSLGVMPYISSAIIMELLTAVFPAVERLKKEGELGRRKMNQYTRYGTVFLAMIQSVFIAISLEGMRGPGGASVVLNPGIKFRMMAMITMTTGTIFLMWLGEQITERGIGNGISLIIYAGIVDRLPGAAVKTFKLLRTGEMSLFVLIIVLLIVVAVVGAIIFVERGHRRIPIQYAKRIVGRKVYGGQLTHLPLKVNTSGVIPPIFASALLMFPLTISSVANVPWLKRIYDMLLPTGVIYNILYGILIIFFAYFYTAIIFNPVDVAENLQKYGGFIPGIRPGKNTSDYIDWVLSRITLGGAIYLVVICILPSILYAEFNVPFRFGGTGLLIAVGVALDTAQQIESHLIMRNYEGFVKGAKLKGRRVFR
jgi:preprotein translocase subunit SecY